MYKTQANRAIGPISVVGEKVLAANPQEMATATDQKVHTIHPVMTI